VWADNETDLDLLGFDELVDELVVALTTPNLLPLTVGVLGDWGSGKSSLLRITRRELEAETDGNGICPYLCVDFSPWLYEDYEDVKTALMRQVLEACRARATAPEALETVERLGRFARLLGRRSRTVGRLALTAAPAALPLVLGMPEMGFADATTSAVQGVAQAVAPLATDALKDEPEPPARNDEIRDLPAFRDEFKKLIASLEGVDAVIVFVDDLDRCLPETVVDTFEAIRLFLNSPQTAYVVAASREIVESAIDSRYPELAREDGRGIGHDYLEKMLQFQVSVPPLSPGQTESYINLLITQLHLSADDFDTVRESLRERQQGDPFAPTFNAATARDALQDLLTDDIDADLSWTGEISEVLGFLRGNPRQVKRFLNELTWRRRAAARRGVDLRHDVLAKLMVLEEQNGADFQTLFDWHRQAGGPSPELALAEAQARSGEAASSAEPTAPAEAEDGKQVASARKGRRAEADADSPPPRSAPVEEADPAADAAASWLARPKTRAWLRLSPALGEIDLCPYFSYFRDRLTVGSATAALRPQLQVLLGDLLSDVQAQSRAALDACKKLVEEEQDLVAGALLDAVARRPDGPGFYSACEFAARMPRTASAICEELAAIPHRALPALRIPGAVRRLQGASGSAELAAGWAASNVVAVAKAAAAALRPRAGA
jgi:hypothetical protein